MTDRSNYVVVVDPLPKDEARDAFRRRLAELGIAEPGPDSPYLIVDVIRMTDNTTRLRYSLHRSLP